MTEGQCKDKTLSRVLKSVFLNDFHIKHKGKLLPFAGYSMPINYLNGIIKEHLHVRKLVGVFDVSHMGQILIPISKHNITSLEKYIPLSLRRMEFNKSKYSFLLNNKGGILDDIIISKILFNKNEYFFIVYNAVRKLVNNKIFERILDNYIYCHDQSLIAIQGPLAYKLLSFLNIKSNMHFMQIISSKYKDHEIIISRSGYTGEDGFEISIPNIILEIFMDKIMKSPNVMLCGLGCRDSLRLEAGLSLYGNELTEEITPVEANLLWAIDKIRLDKCNFNGGKRILHQINTGVKKIKIGIKSASRSMLRSQMKILDKNNKTIGFISSGSFSPILKTSIGLGYIEVKNQNEKLFSLIRNEMVEIEIAKLPFISHNYKKG